MWSQKYVCVLEIEYQIRQLIFEEKVSRYIKRSRFHVCSSTGGKQILLCGFRLVSLHLWCMAYPYPRQLQCIRLADISPVPRYGTRLLKYGGYQVVLSRLGFRRFFWVGVMLHWGWVTHLILLQKNSKQYPCFLFCVIIWIIHRISHK